MANNKQTKSESILDLIRFTGLPKNYRIKCLLKLRCKTLKKYNLSHQSPGASCQPETVTSMLVKQQQNHKPSVGLERLAHFVVSGKYKAFKLQQVTDE